MTKRQSFFCAFLGAVAVILSGCAGSSDSGFEPYAPHLQVFKAPGPLETRLERADLYCPHGLDCETSHASVGLVGIVVEPIGVTNELSLSQCTGFLYGAYDIVALNSHCIPEAVIRNKDNCGEYLGIKFGRTMNQTEEVRMCEQILSKSDLSRGGQLRVVQDYAFFRIKPVAREPMKLAANGTPDRTRVRVLKIDPIQGRLAGTFGKATCVTRMNSLLNDAYSHGGNETALGISENEVSTECRVVEGNSGSPVVDDSLQVVGIAQSKFRDDFRQLLSLTSVARMVLEFRLPPSTPDHFNYTQVACIGPTLANPERRPLCTYYEPSAQPDYQEQLRAIITDAEVAKFKRELQATQTDLLGFEIIDEPNFNYAVRPTCLKRKDLWRQSNQRYNVEESGWFRRRYKIDVPYAVTGARLKAVIEFDREFMAKEPKVESELRHSTLRIDARGDQIQLVTIPRFQSRSPRSGSGSDLLGAIAGITELLDLQRSRTDTRPLSWCPEESQAQNQAEEKK